MKNETYTLIKNNKLIGTFFNYKFIEILQPKESNILKDNPDIGDSLFVYNPITVCDNCYKNWQTTEIKKISLLSNGWKLVTKNSIYILNVNNFNLLERIVNDVISKEYVDEALNILEQSGNTAKVEFLKYYIQDDLNICCLVIDKYANELNENFKHFGF